MLGSPVRSFTLLLASVSCASSAVAQYRIAQVLGTARGDDFGCAVAAAGDLDADGFDDFLVGARREYAPNGAEAGMVRGFSGRDGSELIVYGGQLAQQLGWSVAGAGDVDGDGHADIVAGGPVDDPFIGSSGRALVLSGRTGGIIWTLSRATHGIRFGHAVAGGGDVDGDGFDDVVVTAPYEAARGLSYSGSAYVYSGRTGLELHAFHGDGAVDLFGWSVAIPGDVDGDGFADVVVGALRDDDNGFDCGSARLFSGRTGATLHTFYGDSLGDRAGHAIAATGDVDRDGFPDYVVGAPQDDALAPNAGSAIVVSGRDGSRLFTLTHSAATDDFGSSVGGAGDVDGDGHPDVIVGAQLDDREGPASGAAFVFSGFDGALLHTIRGNSGGDRLGWAVSGAGDADGDGYAEVVVGAIKDGIGGSAELLHLGALGTPPSHRVFGAGCIGGAGRLPSIGFEGTAHLGETFTVTLRGAAPTSNAVFYLGQPTFLALDVIGMPGCALLVDPDGPLSVPTNAFGACDVSFPIPQSSAATGIALDTQWLVLDLAAPYALPVTTSGGMRFRIGD